MTSVEQAVRAFRHTPHAVGHSESTREALREALRSVDLLDGVHAYTVTDSEGDDAALIAEDGNEITTWKQDYPYEARLARSDYERAKRALQIELLKLQSWVKDNGERIVILFEGRDAAGKGGTIKRFVEHLNPRGARVVALGRPTERERTQWYFQRYIDHLPAAGEIVLFDRSWYNRAVVERVMGFCSDDQYEEFMLQVPGLERALVDDGITLIKLWFSVSRAEQRTRFTVRVIDPLRQWKLSPIDLAALDRWDEYTQAKDEMFARSGTEWAPWTVVKSNDKKRCRVEAIRWVLSQLHYPGKDDDAVGTPDPLIVGPPAHVYEISEHDQEITSPRADNSYWHQFGTG